MFNDNVFSFICSRREMLTIQLLTPQMHQSFYKTVNVSIKNECVWSNPWSILSWAVELYFLLNILSSNMYIFTFSLIVSVFNRVSFTVNSAIIAIVNIFETRLYLYVSVYLQLQYLGIHHCKVIRCQGLLAITLQCLNYQSQMVWLHLNRKNRRKQLNSFRLSENQNSKLALC